MTHAFPVTCRPTRRFLALAAVGLSLGSVLAQDAEKITYDDHVRPLLENKCFSCHNPDKKKGGLELTSYAGLMNGGSGGAVVDAGNPSGSRLWTCSAKKEEPFMPPEGAPLEAKDLALLSKWIAGGVLQAKGSVAKTSNRPKVDLSFSGETGKPSGPVARPADVLLEPVLVTPRTTAITAMAASPWTSLLAVAGQKQILLYDTDTKELAGVLPYPEGYARSLRFSANGSLLILGGGRGGKFGHAVVWDVRTGRRVTEVGKEFDQVMSADITPDHRKIVIATNAKKVKCFDVATGEQLYLIAKHTEWVTATDFSPDGILLATADRNGNVFVWEADNGGEFYNLGQHKSGVTDLAWRADSNILASCSTDGTISVWEMKTGKRVANWSAHGGSVQSVAFTPDGRVVSSGNDGRVAIWSLEGKQLAQSEPQGDIVSKVAALYDSKGCVSGNWQGEVRFIDLGNGKAAAQVSSNPPRIADRLAAAEKRLAELVPALGPAQAAQQAAEARLPALEAALAVAKPAGEPAARQLAELEAKHAEQAKGLEYWQGMLRKAVKEEEKTKATKAVADQRSALAHFAKEIAKVRPAAAGFRAAEAALAKARNEVTAAQASVRDIVAETAAHRERIIALKAAQFNVGVLTERDRLAKLEQDIADLVAARAENEAAKVAAARRIESSRQTIARNEALIPEQEAAVKALRAEFAALDRALSPLRLAEAEAQGKIDEQNRFIETQGEAIVRLTQDRDAAVTVIKSNVEDYASKHTRPLRARLNEMTPRVEAARKQVGDLKVAETKAREVLKVAQLAVQVAERALVAQANEVRTSEGVSQSAREHLDAAEKEFSAAREFRAVFSFQYFARKEETAHRLAAAKVAAGEATKALESTRAVRLARQEDLAKAQLTAKAESDRVSGAQSAVAAAEKAAAPLIAEFDAVNKERVRHVAERDRLSAGIAATEKAYQEKLPALQAAVQKAKDALPPLEKALAATRTQLAEAAKPVEAKRAQVEAAARTLDLTRSEKANAEKALAAAEKDIPQRDKNLEEIAKNLAELQPQVEPMKARVREVQEQYLAMLPKRDEAKKN